AELLDESAIALEVSLLEIRQEATAAADELEQTPARVVILRMRAQMLRELVDALREQRDLHLRRARVGLVRPVLTDDVQLGFLRKSQSAPPSSSVPARRRKQAQSRGCGRGTG